MAHSNMNSLLQNASQSLARINFKHMYLESHKGDYMCQYIVIPLFSTLSLSQCNCEELAR